MRVLEATARSCGIQFESYLKDVIPCVLGILRNPESETVHIDSLSLIESMAMATGQTFLEHVDFEHVVAGVVDAIEPSQKHNLVIKLATYQFARKISNSFSISSLDTVEDLHLLVPLLEKSCGLVESLTDTHGTSRKNTLAPLRSKILS